MFNYTTRTWTEEDQHTPKAVVHPSPPHKPKPAKGGMRFSESHMTWVANSVASLPEEHEEPKHQYHASKGGMRFSESRGQWVSADMQSIESASDSASDSGSESRPSPSLGGMRFSESRGQWVQADTQSIVSQGSDADIPYPYSKAHRLTGATTIVSGAGGGHYGHGNGDGHRYRHHHQGGKRYSDTLQAWVQ